MNTVTPPRKRSGQNKSSTPDSEVIPDKSNITSDVPIAPIAINIRGSTLPDIFPSNTITTAEDKAPGANNNPVWVAENPNTL